MAGQLVMNKLNSMRYMNDLYLSKMNAILLVNDENAKILKDMIMVNEKDKRNVFQINWSEYGSYNYILVARNLNIVADKIMKLIIKLKEKFLFPNANMNFIGFSLGVCNIAYICITINNQINLLFFFLKI